MKGLPPGAGACLAVCCSLLSACQVLGPAALEHARPNYNSALQDTEKKEIFSNIIRVWSGEPTLFVNISEVDANLTLQASETSQVSGGSIAAGSFTGPGVTYTDQPIIKYVPLNGPELVDQIAKPIRETSISELLDSDWHLVPVLQFTVDRIAPQYLGMGAALNAIAQLNDYHALAVASVAIDNESTGIALYLLPDSPSIAPVSDAGFGVAGEMTAGQTSSAEMAARKNILHLWIRLLRIYEGTQPAAPKGSCQITPTDDGCLVKLESGIGAMGAADIQKTFASLPRRIFLYSGAGVASSANAVKAVSQDQAPILHTRSALGALKASVRGGGGIGVFNMDNPDDAAKVAQMIKGPSAARPACFIRPDYYVLPLAPITTSEGPDYEEDERLVNQAVRSQRCVQETLFPSQTMDIHDFRALRREFMLLSARYFIVIRRSLDEPTNAYVSYSDGDYWYYIDAKDNISKLNFLLMGQLLTMQAVAAPQSTTPLAISTH